jgi:CheY-like chemotaxis protein
VTTTLLAVDDSKTMRKVLEITFAGEDYKTVLAESSADAMAKLRSENPAIALVDANLGGESGYDLCLQIKQAAPQTVVLVLSSKQAPFDRAKGATAGADDHMDKPFDTQQLIDKVSAAVRKGPTAKPMAPSIQPAPAQPAPGAMRPQPRPQPSPTATRPGLQPSVGPRPPMPGRGPALGPRPAQPAGRQPGSSPQAAGRPPQPQVRPVATQQSRSAPTAGPRPAPQPAAIQRPPAAKPAAAVAAAAAGMAGKLQGLGLTKDQIEGVMALSREVVEQVVWEVVPVLAETIIKEEIKRLTAE